MTIEEKEQWEALRKQLLLNGDTEELKRLRDLINEVLYDREKAR